MADSGATSTWAPLRIRVFRVLWIAALVSNIGTWMQTVGAQWLMIHRPDAALLVSLVQAAYALPAVLFALVGGVLADTFDRRRLLIAVLAGLVVTSASLAALTGAHQMGPALLLAFTFALGTGAILILPAYQSLVPDLVPRPQVPAAAALGSVSINLARAIGPAVAGVLIASAGVVAVFWLNAASLVFYLVVVVFWRPPDGGIRTHPERFGSALRMGGQYVRYSLVVRRILLRAGLFLIPGSALWALLPLIAARRLGLGAGGYGLLLGALGVGAIAGAFTLPWARARLSANALMAVATLTYAAVLVVAAVVRSVPVVLVVLLPAGIAWIAFLSNINAALQLFLPSWVRARGLSVYQMVLFGAQAAGAVLWGAVAVGAGLVPTFLAAAAVMAGGAATIRFWPLLDTAAMDRSPAVYWPEPQLVLDADGVDGPVLVQVTYTIPATTEEQFLRAIAPVRRIRLRTGASDWGLYRDGQNPHSFVEVFTIPTWDEHLRQHNERLTGTDRDFQQAVAVLSDPPPRTEHFLAADVSG